LSAMQDDTRAVSASLLNFVEGRIGRHDNGGRYTEPTGVESNALGMVAGRHGDDAPSPLLCIQAEQLVERATFLERRCELVVFELQPHFRAGQRR